MLCYIIPWKRAWQCTPVFLPGEPHGQRSVVGYSPWGCKESDITERLTQNSNNILYVQHWCEDRIIGKGQALQNTLGENWTFICKRMKMDPSLIYKK